MRLRSTSTFPSQLPAPISPYLPVPSSGMSHMCPHPPFGRVHDLASTLPALAQDRPPTDLVFSRTFLPPEKKSQQVHLARDMAHLPTWEDRRHGGRRPSAPLRGRLCPASLSCNIPCTGKRVGGAWAPGADGGARFLGSLLGCPASGTWQGRKKKVWTTILQIRQFSHIVTCVV